MTLTFEILLLVLLIVTAAGAILVKDLISAVSHDLRTPLASIRAMIESINDGVVTDAETQRRYIRTTLGEVESLGQ